MHRQSHELSGKRATFAHVSDLHLPFEPVLSAGQRLSKRQLSAWSWRRRRAWQSPKILDALVQDLRAQAVGHVLITGDTINFSLPEEFRRAADWLRALAPADAISLVPGNHDALVALPAADGLGQWAAWMPVEQDWPFVRRMGGVSLIGLNSARPTAPLLAQGELGARQLAHLERVLEEEGSMEQQRVLLLHHPVAEAAIGRRKALRDRAQLRAIIRRQGAELLLHGHARDARFDTIPGPREPVPCLCVASSTAVPNPRDEGARWHQLQFVQSGSRTCLEVGVRRWSVAAQAFEDGGRYRLLLPRLPGR